MKIATLLLLLLPGCTMALAGDAQDACERIGHALHSMSVRCKIGDAPGNAPGFCDKAWITDATSEQATQCEEWAATVACKDIDATYSHACEFTRYP